MFSVLFSLLMLSSIDAMDIYQSRMNIDTTDWLYIPATPSETLLYITFQINCKTFYQLKVIPVSRMR